MMVTGGIQCAEVAPSLSDVDVQVAEAAANTLNGGSYSTSEYEPTKLGIHNLRSLLRHTAVFSNGSAEWVQALLDPGLEYQLLDCHGRDDLQIPTVTHGHSVNAVFIVLRGKIRLNGQEYGPPSVVYVPPGVGHTATFLSKDTRLLAICYPPEDQYLPAEGPLQSGQQGRKADPQVAGED